MRIVLGMLALCTVAHAADERAADFASAGRIEMPPAGSHFRVRLSAPVYRATAQRGLGDLRVVNATGEFVPFAFAPREPQRAAAETRTLKLFPLHGDEARTIDGLSLRAERSAAGTVVKIDSTEAPRGSPRKLLGYVAELPELPRPMQALTFDWEAKEGFTGTVRIEVSEDLRRWTAVAPRAPVIQLEHAGERLERKRVEVRASSPGYLRVSFVGVPADFMLKGIACELAAERPEPVRESFAVAGTQVAAKKNDYQFDTVGSFPVDRIRFALPQANTIAPVHVLTRDRPEDSWRPLVAATVYRLSRDGGEIVSPDIAVAPTTDRYWLLRVDARSGGLGAGDVQLVASWQSHEIVFAARGAAPFALLVGSKTASGTALPIATVLPGYRDGEPVPAGVARLGELGANSSAARKAEDPIASARAFAGSAEGRKWILWTVLVAGVLFLIWMATRLMRDLGKAQVPPKQD
jgi:hypothetical protein